MSEAIGLRGDEIDLDQARVWVRRLKSGLPVEQPIAGDELRAIKRHLGFRSDALPWLFLSERDQPLTRQSVNYLLAAAARAGLPPVRPHICAIPAATISPKGLRPASDPGLSGPSRSQAHRPLHADRRKPLRGVLAMSGTAHHLGDLIKWTARDGWRDRVDAVMAEHFEPAMQTFDLTFEEIDDALGGGWAGTLWGCAFEDFLTRRFGPESENPVEAYLRRRGWKERVAPLGSATQCHAENHSRSSRFKRLGRRSSRPRLTDSNDSQSFGTDT